MSAWRVSDLAQKVYVKCRFKSGNCVDLQVLDISHGGCMVDQKNWGAVVGERALVQLPGLAFQPVTIAWVEDEKAGLAFEQPLHEAVLVHLWQTYSGPAAA